MVYNVGDLVRYTGSCSKGEIGLVLRVIPGWAEYHVIQWIAGQNSTVEGKNLELVSGG